MPISELPGLVCEDISNGQENFRIPATNLVDNSPIPPSVTFIVCGWLGPGGVLEVFKTKSKGWGVRTWDSILPGALICEYTGVLRRTTEVEGLLENNYIFDIDCLQTMEGLDGREQRAGSELHMASLHSEHDSEVASRTPEYCIDAGSVGNIARFINHSCQPNLFIQCVLSSHRDIKLAKVMLFAADTRFRSSRTTTGIGWTVSLGQMAIFVKLACHCGASDCRKRLY
ncbi:unnamed protein product [Miscanthus lutarioriparius]|uniref:Uncharacterized protein n=1 Tax=Miscanthus lutarioriparius TaxID=422564 RepID=A0A811RYM4_9POAL|nr:unnamed protein product [Miscanthus lutarioriparius]